MAVEAAGLEVVDKGAATRRRIAKCSHELEGVSRRLSPGHLAHNEMTEPGPIAHEACASVHNVYLVCLPGGTSKRTMGQEGEGVNMLRARQPSRHPQCWGAHARAWPRSGAA